MLKKCKAHNQGIKFHYLIWRPTMPVSMLILKRFELENFKSYYGKHTFGPFMHFTAIVGPNGSGKSNLMDAVSFVLGEKLQKLRVSESKDLIYGSLVRRSEPNYALVKIYLTINDKPFTLSRKVSQDAESYKINENDVTRINYMKFLETNGIFIKHKNFLIFQGDIESIASESSKLRTCIFEKFSGSDKLAKRYDICQRNLKHEMENFTNAIRKKREAVTEKRKLDFEKHEAGKYSEMKVLIETYEKDIALLQLKSLNFSIDEHKSSLTISLSDKSKVSKDLSRQKIEYSTLKSETASLFNKISSYENKYSEFEIKTKNLKSKYDSLSNKVTFLQNKIQNENKTLEKSVLNHQKTLNQITDLQQNIEEAERMLSSLDSQSSIYSSKHHLTEEQYKEYLDLRAEAQNMIIPISEDMNRLIRERDLLLAKIQSLSSTILQINKRREIISDNDSDVSLRLNKLKESLKSLKSLLKEKQESIQSITQEVNHAKHARDATLSELEKIGDSLSYHKVDSVENERQRKLNEINEKLRMFFPGVYGRLGDLIEPTHHRFSIALTKVLGKYIDSIVVDHHKTAFECIEFLKEQQLGRAIFLPLSDLKTKQPNEKYRHLGGTSKLLLDVIHYESHIKPAVLFVFGNTIVCDDIDEAHSVAFNALDRRKVVSLDGTMFLKSGIISGGSSTLAARAKRFDEKRLKEFQKERDRLQNSLQSFNTTIEKGRCVDELGFEVQKIEQKIRCTEDEINHLKQVTTKLKEDAININEQIENLQKDRNSCSESLNAKNSSIEDIKIRIEEINKTVFSHFMEKYSISGLESLECANVKELRELSARKETCENHINILRNQLTCEISRSKMNKIDDIKKRIEETNIEYNLALDEHKTLKEQLDEHLQKIDKLKSHLSKKNKIYTEKNNRLRELQKSLQELEKQQSVTDQVIYSLEMKLENILNQKYQLLKQTKIKNMNIVREGLDNVLPELSSQSQSTQSLEDDDRLIAYDSEKARCLLDVVVDFSHLSEQYQKISDVDEIKDAIDTINSSIKNTQIHLTETVQPNMKVLEKYDERIEHVNRTTSEYVEIKQRVKSAQKEFELVKRERTKLFMEAFEIASVKVDQIYKSICNDNNVHAYLTLDDSDEPYLGGISYNCVAPKKRYQSIESLSGGEKSLAALALILALQRIHPSPFMVFDEVDSALDSENILNLANYLRYNNEYGAPYIVISLKEELFNKANALIGVTSDPNCDIPTSRIFTLNLDKYSD